jgi:hypothetical protein
MSFTQQVNAWIDKAERRIDKVIKQSAADVFAEAQRPVAEGGNMPVDTGFLRASLQTDSGGSASSGPDSYLLAIAGMQPGDPITGVWTAEYARHVEYGARGRPPRRFVGQAAAQWPEIVARSVAKVRNMP